MVEREKYKRAAWIRAHDTISAHVLIAVLSKGSLNDPENRRSHVLAAGDQGSDRSHGVVSRYLKLKVVI